MKRLTKKQMWIFAIGQLGWSLLGGIINTWLVTFYLPTADDVAKGAIQYLKPGLIIAGCITLLGLITAICRLFDAVTDPLIASLSDRSTNKRGRRIPFMQFSAIPFAILTIVVFCAPVEKTSGINFAWVLVFLILFYLFMTLYCTPYNALISEFGKTQEDRMYISTAISLTYFFGLLLAYVPFVIAGPLQSAGLSFAWSYRVCFIILAVIACVCMLLPTFLLNEKEFVDAKPSQTNVFKSLTSTFKNRDFRVFVGSDIMYWVGLTLFQTGLPYFVKVLMHDSDGSTTLYYMAAMTVLSAALYPVVSKLVMKFGKKKLVICGFLGLALAYLFAALSNVLDVKLFGEFTLCGILIVIVAAFPMALLGIIPQSIVADIAEEDSLSTGENRQGMFFAARTFAMKLGQTIAMLAFTSLAIIGTAQAENSSDIVASVKGCTIVAIVAIVFCVLGAVILMFYNEKRVMEVIAKPQDEAFLKAVEETPAEVKEDKAAKNVQKAEEKLEKAEDKLEKAEEKVEEENK